MPPAVLDAPASIAPASSVFLDAPRWDHSTLPAWFAELQHVAWEEFATLPMPGRKDESWRFADLGKLKFGQYVDAAPVDDETVAGLIERSVPIEDSAGRLIFVNDRLVHADASLAAHGVTAETLPHGCESAKHLLNSLSARLGSRKFVSLHQAHLKNAVIITAAKNTTVKGVVEIFHWAAGENAAVFPRTILHAKEQAHVSVLEHHRSADGAPIFSCGAAQLVAGRGASIDYVLCQLWNLESRAVHMSSTHCGPDSRVNHCLANLGAGWNRTECVSHLEGAGSRSDMLSVSLGDDDQENDQRTLQLHHAPHSNSDLLYKNVLFGRSRSIFAGLISVDAGAHFTDAYQTCRNLLMTDECEANAMPGLEINADQVKCSHGSTSGAIDPEEIFYFQSRGISEDTARGLLAQGFLGQTLDRVTDENVRHFLLQEIARRFEEAVSHA